MSDLIDAPLETTDESVAAGAHNSVQAVLVGGPTEFPTALRVRQVSAAERKVKILYRNGYEHFELVEPAGHSESVQRVFSWTGRTRIAE